MARPKTLTRMSDPEAPLPRPADAPFAPIGATRRSFLRGSIGFSGALLVGCETGGSLGDDDDATDDDDAVDDDDAADDDDAVDPCDDPEDPLAGGTFVRTLEFLGITRDLDTDIGGELDGRRYVDLTGVDTTGDGVVSNEDFYIRTMASELLPPAEGWTVTISGLVDTETTLEIDALRDRATDQGLKTLECSGNGGGGGFGLLSTARWAGVPLMELLNEAGIDPSATAVRVTGFDTYAGQSDFSTPGAEWVFPLDQVEEYGAFLATEMNGEPLPLHHGRPVRLYVPRWYGCTNIKWVQTIELVDDAVQSTSQMREFAGRTHQPGVPELARDFIPATQDQAAMPIRVEQWELEGGIVHRIVGVSWGGYEPTRAFAIRIDGGSAEEITVCPGQAHNDHWGFWEHVWRPARPGFYEIELEVTDSSIRTRRLDTGFYSRTVEVVEA